jgi:transposase
LIVSIAWTRQVTVTKIICGVDVSGASLDARVGQTGPYDRFENNAEGINRLAAFCHHHQVELVAMEATGGYEKLPFTLLWQQELPCAIVNPRQVRRFAEGMGIIEKTDRIDAGMIAAYALARKTTPQSPAQANQKALSSLAIRIRQLVEAKVAQGNQRRFRDEAIVTADIDSLVADLERRITSLQNAVLELIDQDPLWSALSDSFRVIKGVANRCVTVVLALLPEIGTISNKAIAKLVGLAPIAHDSGKRNGKRSIRGGRAGVRSILFVIAEAASKHEPDIRQFHQRLIAAGKPPLVAKVAVAHKILTRLNAKARDARNALAVTT